MVRALSAEEQIRKQEDLLINNKLSALFARMSDALPGFDIARFNRGVGEYCKESRFFHGLPHLIDMTEFNDSLPGMAGIYSMVAGFYHDSDYPSIKEQMSSESARHILKYVEIREGKEFLKPLHPDDRIGRILYATFGYSEGQELQPIAGMNEFHSACRAAGELSEIGMDEQFVLAIVAGIEATIAFSKDPERMNKLKDRVKNASRELGLGVEQTGKVPPLLILDEIMIGAVHTANRDMRGFLGGLDPQITQTPTVESVLQTIRGGDLLSPEEVKALRRVTTAKTVPGEYTPAQFLEAKNKRAGLYQFAIPGDDELQTIPNMHHNVTLSTNTKYPTDEWKDLANKLGYAINRPVRVAEYARLISAGVVASIVDQAKDKIDSTTITLKELMNGIIQRIDPGLPPGSSETKRLAFACLDGRLAAANGYDTNRSPLAELIVHKLDVAEIEELGKAARKFLAPPSPGQPVLPDSKGFLELATERLGSTVGQIRSEMVTATRGKLNAACEALKKVTLPPVIGID